MVLTVDPTNKSELCCSLACLVLFDHEDAVGITAENIAKVLTAAGVEKDVEPYWPTQFASLLDGKDVKDLIMNAGAASGGGGGGAAAGGEAATEAAAEPEPEPEEEEEDEDEDMGFSLFD